MANNKVQLANGLVLIDLTSDTVDAAHLADGYTAHDASGAAITGTMSGGGGLSLTVVGGTTQPSSPTENTIWVNTSTEITSWCVQFDEPASPSTGDVWIVQRSTANNYINVSDTSPVYLGIGAARQWNGSSWDDLEGAVYANGVWTDLQLFIYYVPDYNSKYSWQSYGAYTVSNSEIGLRITSAGSNGIYATELIDLTDVDSVVFDMALSNAGAVNNWYVSVSETTGSFANAYTNAEVKSPNWNSGEIARQKYTLDVSGLAGFYYINIGGRRSSGTYVFSLYSLELA